MSRIDEVTGQVATVGNKVSHSNIKTKTRNEIGLMLQRFWNPETKKWVKLRVTNRTKRTIGKKGLLAVLRKARKKNGKQK